MTRTALRPAYGSRGKLGGSDDGIRRVAPTYGKTRHLAHSSKAGGNFTPESRAERLIGDVLALDPRVESFRCQPFCIDLIDRRILRTPEERTAAKKRHAERPSPRLYTPDFLAQMSSGQDLVLEVKAQGHEGDANYDLRLRLASEVLRSAGYGFMRVVVPDDPWAPVNLNVSALSLAACRPDLRPNGELVQALAALCGDSVVRLGDICMSLAIPAALTPGLFVGGALAGDLVRQPINSAMEVTYAHGRVDHMSFLEELAT